LIRSSASRPLTKATGAVESFYLRKAMADSCRRGGPIAKRVVTSQFRETVSLMAESAPCARRLQFYEADRRGRILADASRFSGLKAKLWTRGARVPDLHSAVKAGRGEPPAVRAEGHANHVAGVALEGEGFLAGGHLPDLHRAVGAGRG